MNVVQFNSILTLTGISTDPHRLECVPRDFPRLQISIASSRCLGYPQLLSNLATNQRSHGVPHLDCDYLLEQSQNSGKHLLMLTSLLYNDVKGRK